MFNHKGEIGLPLVIKKFILMIIEFVDRAWKLMKINNRPNWNNIFKLKIEHGHSNDHLVSFFTTSI